MTKENSDDSDFLTVIKESCLLRLVRFVKGWISKKVKLWAVSYNATQIHDLSGLYLFQKSFPNNGDLSLVEKYQHPESKMVVITDSEISYFDPV